MNAFLRTTLLSAVTLALTASAANADVKGSISDALHQAQKDLSVVEANIKALEARIATVEQEMAEAWHLYRKTGEPEYREIALAKLQLRDRLRYQLTVLQSMAEDLRARIAKLSGQISTPVVFEGQPTSAAPASLTTSTKKG